MASRNGGQLWEIMDRRHEQAESSRAETLAQDWTESNLGRAPAKIGLPPNHSLANEGHPSAILKEAESPS